MRFILSITFLLLPILLVAQTTFAPSVTPRSLAVEIIVSPIKMDGQLDEAAWRVPNIADDFIQYIGVMCFDTVGRNHYRTPDLKRDFNWRSFDMFAIAIDGYHDRRNSMTFATNAYGAQKDYLSFDDILFDGDWNGLWNVRTARTDSAWSAEFVIPWKTLRYTAQPNRQIWGINFLRLRRLSNEIATWSPYPRVFGFNRMEYAGNLTHVQPAKNATNVQVNPYALYARQRGTKGEIKSDPKIGGEVKWAINQNAVLDLTYNTDFAQTDADVQVNNLTRFSIFFPEKRQFFLENASLFGGNLSPDGDNSGGDMVIQPFFSRSIGLDASGNPIPIDFGARFVQRSLKQSFGGMFIQQRASALSPLSHFFVSRYSRNIGEQHRFGGMFLIKNQQPLDQRKEFGNLVGMVDGFFRLSPSKNLYFMAVPSANTDQTGKGFSGFMRYMHTSNQLKFGGLRQSLHPAFHLKWVLCRGKM